MVDKAASHQDRTPRRKGTWAKPLILASVVAGLSACAEGPPADAVRTVSDFDGTWEFTFAATTPTGVNGARCLDGTGEVSVENGRVIGTTFSEFGGVMRSRGELEGRIVEAGDGTFFTIARSQGGRNAFTAEIDRSKPGMTGTWEDIHACKGSFSASRV